MAILDLYATNYVEFDPQKNIVCAEGGIRSYCEPKFYEPVGDVLYRNEDGQLRDVASAAGIIHKGARLGRGLRRLRSRWRHRHVRG